MTLSIDASNGTLTGTITALDYGKFTVCFECGNFEGPKYHECDVEGRTNPNSFKINGQTDIKQIPSGPLPYNADFLEGTKPLQYYISDIYSLDISYKQYTIFGDVSIGDPNYMGYFLVDYSKLKSGDEGRLIISCHYKFKYTGSNEYEFEAYAYLEINIDIP
ncbi:hypothetical protein FACS189459_6140 [Bacilli bacterium]|nr:hypothetical protein FACS189459_6140 [Bacilli bacterium]GHU52007.1 hypothetical protein FACS189496_1390 [Bacilli bacterium]